VTTCSITSSGACEKRKVVPGCPSCPPGFFSLLLRKLFGCRAKRSEEGGKLLLWLSFASRSCKSFTRIGSKPPTNVPPRGGTCNSAGVVCHESTFTTSEDLLKLVGGTNVAASAPTFFPTSGTPLSSPPTAY